MAASPAGRGGLPPSPPGAPRPPVIPLLRGVGRTVLLDAFEDCELFLAVGAAAKEKEDSGVIFLLDEVQFAKEVEQRHMPFRAPARRT